MERQPTSHTKRPRARSRAKTKKKSKRGKKSNTSPHKHQQTSSKTGKQKIESTGRRRKAEARSVVTQHCVPDNQQRVQKAQKTQQQSGTESSHSKRKKKKKKVLVVVMCWVFVCGFVPAKTKIGAKEQKCSVPCSQSSQTPMQSITHHTSRIQKLQECGGLCWGMLRVFWVSFHLSSPLSCPSLDKRPNQVENKKQRKQKKPPTPTRDQQRATAPHSRMQATFGSYLSAGQLWSASIKKKSGQQEVLKRHCLPRHHFLPHTRKQTCACLARSPCRRKSKKTK